MPVISASFDTTTKSCTVLLDGVPVTDLDEIHLCKCYDGRFSMELVSRKEDRTAGTYTSTRIMASQNGELVAKPEPNDAEVYKAIAQRYSR